jgi:general secretion pathway protein D
LAVINIATARIKVDSLQAENKTYTQITTFIYAVAFSLPTSLLSIVCLILSLSQVSYAQQNISAVEKDVEIEAAEEQFILNMRDANIQGFIQWVANRTGKNMVIHRSVKGTVTILSSRTVSPDEAYELFLTVLRMNNFAAVESDGVVKIIPAAEAKTDGIPFMGEQIRNGTIVTAIIDVEHSNATELMGLVRPLIPASSHIASYNQTNTLIIADSARNIAKITRVIEYLDIIPIIYASADEISSTLSKVVKSLSGSKAALTDQDKVEFAVDKRSNSILITGNATKRQQIKDLIKKLDLPLEGGGNTQVVYLNYIEASEITPILKSVGDSVIKDSKSESTQSFSIESSETTNALIMTGPPGLLSNLRSVIKQLDIQRAQVLIEAVVVQVSGDAGEDFGVVWGGSEIYEENRTGGIGAVNTPAANAGFGSIFGAAIPTGSTDSPTSTQLAAGVLSNSGLTYGYLKDGNLVAALRAITTRNKSNIMSTPTIVALDNEEASLLVGQSVPFITGSSTSAGSTTANPFQTIQRQDIGITLNVTPRINQGDSITLEIEQTTENVSPTANSQAADLITEKTEIKTSALIRDGQVLVLGGLIREDDVTTRTQVPLLGDVPLLGRLFRSSSVSKRKNNLMVFIRPVILKDQLQMSGLTAQRYAFMREKQMQNALSTFIKLSENPALAEFEEFQEITPQQTEAN